MTSNISVIPKIYEAVLHPEKWPETLSLFAEKAKAKSSVLYVTEDEHLNYECIAASNGWSRRQLFEYSKRFFATEIDIFRLLSRQHIRNFILDRRLHFDESHYWEKPINHWMRDSLGVHHRSGAGLHSHDAWVGIITLQYGIDRETIEHDELNMLNKYVSHFSRAIELSRTLTTLKKRFGASYAALDHLEQAVIVLNNRRQIIVKNSAAINILKHKDGLSVTRENTLFSTDAASMKSLSHILDQTFSISEKSSNENPGPITIKRSNHKPSYIMEVAPIIDSVDKIDGHSNGAIIFMIDPAAPSKVSVKGMAKLYGLTTTEESITQLLVSGQSLAQISEIRSTSIQTVRTQIKTILNKTNTHTQANLVRLAYLLNPPIIA